MRGWREGEKLSGLGWGGWKGKSRKGCFCRRRRKEAEEVRGGRSHPSKAGGHSASGDEGTGAPARASEAVDKGWEGVRALGTRVFRKKKRDQWTPLEVRQKWHTVALGKIN